MLPSIKGSANALSDILNMNLIDEIMLTAEVHQSRIPKAPRKFRIDFGIEIRLTEKIAGGAAVLQRTTEWRYYVCKLPPYQRDNRLIN
jgi:hypothetical protein